MHKQDFDDDLFAEALRLLDDVRDTQSERALHALDEWRRLSEDHRKAVTAARKYAELTRSTAPVRFAGKQRSLIVLQTWLARLQERGRSLAAAGLTATALFAFVIVTQQSDPGNDERAPLEPPTSVETAQHSNRGVAAREVALPDGSTMWLGARTVAGTRFGQDVRHVVLERGRVAFRVVSNPAAPFTVEAGEIRSQVTGTEFTVGYLNDRASVEVAVIEGSVNVSGSDPVSVSLGPENAVRTRDGVLGDVTNRPMSEIGSWRDGMLVFRKRPLVEAIETIEPYTSYRIDSSRLYSLGREVSGTYLTDRADAGLRSILEAHRLSLTQEPPNTLILEEPPIARPTFRPND